VDEELNKIINYLKKLINVKCEGEVKKRGEALFRDLDSSRLVLRQYQKSVKNILRGDGDHKEIYGSDIHIVDENYTKSTLKRQNR